MARVVIEHLSKVFPGPRGDGAPAVDDLNLIVEDEEFLVLAGPSGCGKTTTLRLIAGLEEASQGTISIGGKVMDGVRPKDRGVAMVFQNHALYPHMTAWENMAFGLKVRQIPRAQIEARITEAAAMLGIANCLERRPHALSGGERQRVALGRGLVLQPKVLLLDEPLSNLDAPLRAQMRAELARLHSRLGCTTIYVTHDHFEALALGHRLAVMKSGTLQQVAEPLALYRQPANRFVASFFGSPPMNFFNGVLTWKPAGVYFAEQTNGRSSAMRPFVVKVSDETATLNDFLDKPIVLGIRPDQITEEPAGSDGIEATLEFVEMAGEESYLHFVTAGHKCVVRTRIADERSMPYKTWLRLDMQRASLFDAETGQSLRCDGLP